MKKHSTTPGVGDDGNYTLVYNAASTFTYDGGIQTILGSGTYGILELTGGEKRIFALDLADANPPDADDGASGLGTQIAAGNVEATTMNSNAKLVVSGDGGNASLDIAGGTLNGAVDITGNDNGSATIITSNGTGANITFNGAVNIAGNTDKPGKIDINGAGVVTIANTGSLVLGGNNTGAILDMAAGSHLNVVGQITNQQTDPTNLVLNNSNAGSTITYAGGQTALATVATHPYSHVVIGGAVGLAGNAYVAGSMELQTGGVFNTIKGGASSDSKDIDDYNKIVFTTNTANLVNENNQDCGEVRGIVARNAWNNTTLYSFNNIATSLKFATSSTSSDKEIGFFVLPNTGPTFKDDQWNVGNQENYVHIARRYIQPYAPNGPVDIAVGTLSMGYTGSERNPNANDDFGGFELNKGYRTFEGQNATNADLLSTAVTETQTDNECFYIAKAANVTSFGEPTYENLASNVATTSQLLITQNAPALITSIRNGRWSDPQTWSAGAQPISSDFVELNHKVWTGDGIGYFDGTGSRKYAKAEHEGAGVNEISTGVYQLAAKLTLMPATSGTSSTPGGGLFIGQSRGGTPSLGTDETGSANDGIYVFGDVINDNTTLAGSGFGSDYGTGGVAYLNAPHSAADLQGIYISPANNTELLKNIFRAKTLENKGSATNFGVAEIGTE